LFVNYIQSFLLSHKRKNCKFKCPCLKNSKFTKILKSKNNSWVSKMILSSKKYKLKNVQVPNNYKSPKALSLKITPKKYFTANIIFLIEKSRLTYLCRLHFLLLKYHRWLVFAISIPNEVLTHGKKSWKSFIFMAK